MSQVRLIRVGKHKVGITGLDEVIEELAPAYAHRSDAEVAHAMMEWLSRRNYFPAPARQEYEKALVREFRRKLGQPVKEEKPQGLEIKLLGSGCASCQQFRKRLLRVLEQSGLPADLEEIHDAMEMAAHGVMLTPGLIINGKVVSVGKVPSEQEIHDWLREATQ